MTSVSTTTDPGGRDAVRLRHGDDEVLIALLGAQVLTWQHRGRDVLWTATAATYEPGKPVRGGVPIVFPWFGDHRTDPSLPAHGFVRTQPWTIAESGPEARVELTTSDTSASRALWPHRFELRFEVRLGTSLRLALTIVNRDPLPLRCEEALHSYFAVGDVRQASVHGLEHVPFVEHAREPEGAWDPGAPLCFRAETDRVFQQMPARVRLHAPALGRELTLMAPAARSAIVWNPWPAKTARLSQMAADDWIGFVCIETANVHDGALHLMPGESHTMALELTVSGD
ncbi:MAG: D-hexose-6-phosphate mutarotase [Planctomycetes bacterium]|nr:D-hexose-6-phosphate mutarotase [Planctomycetota bacterium]